MAWGDRRASRAGTRSAMWITVATTLALCGSVLPPVATGALADDTVTVVQGEEFQPVVVKGTPSLTERERENLRLTVPRTLERPGARSLAQPLVVQRSGGTDVPGGATTDRAVTPAADAVEGASAMTYGQNAWMDDPYGPRATLAVLGSRSVVADRHTMHWMVTNDLSQIDTATSSRSFFDVPRSEGSWGPTVIASLKFGRFVAVMPSFQGPAVDCAKGYLNLAISKTSNPMGRWLRYRIPMTDAWSDLATIGASDDKIVLTSNQWDLSTKATDCLGGTWEGARLRVLDWKDALDGGSLAVKDVTPSGATSYWSWMPAAATPGVASTSTGTAVRVMVDRRVDGLWGNVGYGTVTGSAKAGTAKLATNHDLTALLDLRPLLGTPDTILGMASGNGGLDESVVSAATQGARLYFTTHDSCKLIADTEFRSCIRIVELDTSTSVPALVQDVMYVGMEADTYLPFVGITRDGTAFLDMARSSAIAAEPTDHYVVYREAGEQFSEGDFEVQFEAGVYRPSGPTGMQGSMVPDPSNPHRIIAEYGVEGNSFSAARATAFVGNLTGDGAIATIGTGQGWADTWRQILRVQEGSGPAMWVRWSASPATTDTPQGAMLTQGAESAIIPSTSVDFASGTIGGNETDPFTAYVQWRTGDGRWSPVTAYPISIDTVDPVMPVPVATLLTGKVVEWQVPMHAAWATPTDDEAGLWYLTLAMSETSSPLRVRLDPAATSYDLRMDLGATPALQLQGMDRAGNLGWTTPTSIPLRAVYNHLSVIKYSSGWTKDKTGKALYDALQYATKAGAKATYTFTGRTIGLVTTKGPNRGKAEIWVDGVLAQTLDLYQATMSYREIAWAMNWETAGQHTVVVKVLGTNGRPRIDLDVFLRI